MTLLEISDRIEYIREAKANQGRGFLRDLSAVMFYCNCFSDISVNGKKNNGAEKEFHKTIDSLLNPDYNFEERQNSPEDALSILG